MKHLICVILFALLNLPLQASTHVYTWQTAYALDPDDQLDIETLDSTQFKPYRNDLNQGFQAGTIWIRLTISPRQLPLNPDAATEPDRSPAFIRVGPFGLDQVQLHQKMSDRWVSELAGDLLPRINQETCPRDSHCFELHDPQRTGATVYLRVQSRGVSNVRVSVLQRDEVSLQASQHLIRTTASLTIAGVLLLLGLVLLIDEYRSLLVLTYCGFQLTLLVFLIAATGTLPEVLSHWSLESVDLATHAIYLLRVDMTALLCFVAMNRHQPTPLYRRLCALLLAACLAGTLMLATGHIRLALQINTFVFVSNALIHLYGCLSARDLTPRYRWVQSCIYTIYAVSAVTGAGIAYGLLDGGSLGFMPANLGDWRLNGLPFALGFFLFLLVERASKKAEHSRELELLRFKLAEARTNEEKLRERRGLIDMLTHELKNPLATIRFAVSSLQRGLERGSDASGRLHSIEASVNRMDDFIEHVAVSNRIELAQPNAQAELIPALSFIEELTGDHPDPGRFKVFVERDAAFRADRKMLTVLMDNLIRNAHNYAAQSSPIDIRVTRQPPSTTQFVIINQVTSDTRPDAQRLFERYYRHTAVLGTPGSGLGLSIARLAAGKIGASLEISVSAQQVSACARVPS